MDEQKILVVKCNEIHWCSCGTCEVKFEDKEEYLEFLNHSIKKEE